MQDMFILMALNIDLIRQMLSVSNFKAAFYISFRCVCPYFVQFHNNIFSNWKIQHFDLCAVIFILSGLFQIEFPETFIDSKNVFLKHLESSNVQQMYSFWSYLSSNKCLMSHRQVNGRLLVR